MNEIEQPQELNETAKQAQPPLPNGETEKRSQTWVFIVVAVVVIAAIIAGTVFLITSDAAVTSKIRDIFIIFMALEALVIGVALVILIIQVAVLTNLIQNEVKPILDSTNETVSTLRGTVRFLSDNLSEPIIVLNEYLAAIKRMLELMRFRRK